VRAARGARRSLAVAAALSVLVAAAVRLPSLRARGAPAAAASGAAPHVPAAAAGVLAAPLAAMVAAQLVAPGAALWAGLVVALSPIHALASRQAAPEALLVSSLLIALRLAAALDRHGHRALAVALGLAVGGLAASGVAAFAAVGILLPVFPATRPDRRAAAALVAGVALAVVATAASLGLARSPLDYGEIPQWVPPTTLLGVWRCAGASFTRVVGLEYQLVVSHARYVLPLTALFVALMLWGAVRLRARPRGLLVAGALFPFVLGATLAVIEGHVAPLQANRLLAAMPFVALLTAAGLASLKGTRAWAGAAFVFGTLAAFLALALAR